MDRARERKLFIESLPCLLTTRIKIVIIITNVFGTCSDLFGTDMICDRKMQDESLLIRFHGFDG